MLEHIFETLRPDEQIYVWAAPPKHERRLVDTVEEVSAFADKYKHETDVYFGVCPRVRGEIDTPARATVLWADFDIKGFNNSFEQTVQAFSAFPLLPTFVVRSGHGFHTYWLLDRSIMPKEAQDILRPMCASLGADATHDPTRVLRVPDTFNHKDPEDVLPVSVAGQDLTRVYDPFVLARLQRVPRAICCHLRDGTIVEERNGRTYKIYKSRSERDWEIVRQLVGAGLDKDTIRKVFEQHPNASDRYVESKWRLFDQDYEKATGSLAGSTGARFSEIEDCLYYNGPKGSYQVASFVFHPERLLEDPKGQIEDAFIGTVKSAGKSWENVVFQKTAFASSSNFIKSLPSMFWTWHASDAETKYFQEYLMKLLEKDGMKHSFGTDVIGRHDKYWVAKDFTLSVDQEFSRNEAPYAYLPLQANKTMEADGTVPTLKYPVVEDDEEYRNLVRALSACLPFTNRLVSSTVLMGWFFASPLKTLLREGGVRFPLLNVYGTQGSGKTSSLLQIFMPLLGVNDPKTWTPNTTTFIIRKLLAGTNSIPVIFGEFRVATTRGLRSDFLRVLLMSYDSGIDARGRADLSSETYMLDAPIIIDGEDALSDPAARERSLLVALHPEDISPTTEAFKNFQRVRSLPLHNFARRYIQHTLRETPATVLTRYEKAMALALKEVPQSIPDRVRNNLAVMLLGLDYYNEYVQMWGGTPVKWSGDLFTPIMNDVLRVLKTGVTRIVIDSFIEDLINEVAERKRFDLPFPMFYDDLGNIVWFPLHPVFRWWEKEQKMRGRDVLEMYSLQMQLQERSRGVGYVLPQREVENTLTGTMYCFGVDLNQARSLGLDIPHSINVNTFRERRGLIVSNNKLGVL